MLWAMLMESLYITWWFWTRVFPALLKIVAVPIKLSFLHLSTFFKGWLPVAQAMAATWMVEEIAKGKIPQNPPQRIINGLLVKANSTIAAGAAINVFAGFWIILHLIY
jgi:hypothetical protein